MYSPGEDIYGSRDHQAFRETVRKFVQTELAPRAREFDKLGRIDKSLYRKMGDLDRAIQALGRAVRLEPNDAFSHYLLARCYFEKGLPRPAEEEALLVLSGIGDHLGSLLLLAEIHSGSGDYPTAAAYLARAVRLDPEDLTVRLLYAQNLALAKDYEKALTEYESLSPIRPDDPSVHHQLGMLFVLTGRTEAAIPHFLREWELAKDPEALYLLGMTCGRLGRYAEAVGWLERYRDSFPPGATDKRQKAEAALRMFRSKRPLTAISSACR